METEMFDLFTMRPPKCQIKCEGHKKSVLKGGVATATVCFISLQTAKQAGQERLQVRERDCERKLGRDNEGNRKGGGGVETGS